MDEVTTPFKNKDSKKSNIDLTHDQTDFNLQSKSEEKKIEKNKNQSKPIQEGKSKAFTTATLNDISNQQSFDQLEMLISHEKNLPKCEKPENLKHLLYQPTEQLTEQEIEKKHSFTPSTVLNAKQQSRALDHNLQLIQEKNHGNECGEKLPCTERHPQHESFQETYTIAGDKPEISNAENQDKIIETGNSLEPPETKERQFESDLNDAKREDENWMAVKEGNMEKHILENKSDAKISFDKNPELHLSGRSMKVASEPNENEICGDILGQNFTTRDTMKESSNLPLRENLLEQIKSDSSKTNNKCSDDTENLDTTVDHKKLEENIQEEDINDSNTIKNIKENENGTKSALIKNEQNCTAFEEDCKEEQENRKFKISSAYQEHSTETQLSSPEHEEEKLQCSSKHEEEKHKRIIKEGLISPGEDQTGEMASSEQQVKNSNVDLRVFGKQVSRVKG